MSGLAFVRQYSNYIPAITTLILRFVVDTTSSAVLSFARYLYIVGKTAELVLFGVMYYKISQNKEEGSKVIRVTNKDMQPPNPLAEMFDLIEDEEPFPVRVRDYDAQVLFGEVKQMALQSCVVSFIHYRYQYVIPLIFTVLLAFVSKPNSHLFRYYMLGERARELKRPFKYKTNTFFQAMLDYQKKEKDKENKAKLRAEKKKKKEKRKGKKGRR